MESNTTLSESMRLLMGIESGEKKTFSIYGQRKKD